jgi:hypothetical protein
VIVRSPVLSSRVPRFLNNDTAVLDGWLEALRKHCAYDIFRRIRAEHDDAKFLIVGSICRNG